MDNLDVQITLSVSEVNQTLAIIAERKLSEVLVLFNKIKGQGDAQVEAARRAATAPVAATGE